ncbi:MAG: glycosyltransferase family 4 protein [Actinobacteria bacterium]|nr:MAG: glycosyltransferase family 4 protein [Actinomycetota bacterium]
MKPRVLFVGRTRYRLPLDPAVAPKWEALGRELDVRVVGTAAPDSAPGDGTFRLVPRRRVLDGPRFWAGLPVRVAREIRGFRPEAIVTQTAYEAAAALAARRLTRSDARVVLEVHGDWRTSTRLYGSPARRALGGLGDRIAAWAVRRADVVRTVSPFTSSLVRELGVEPAATFPAYMHLEPFVERPPAPLPEQPVALFVGVLEAYKNVDGLAAAWRLVAPRAPDATLRIVGRGTRTDVVESLVHDLPAQTRWDKRLSADEVVRALDDATVLVLPSRSEGMGRVLVEAFCRGRGVVGTRAGSIPDLVEDGVNGLLVEPGDEAALADAIVRVLTEPGLAERLGEAARERAASWLQTPDEYAARVRALV